MALNGAGKFPAPFFVEDCLRTSGYGGGAAQMLEPEIPHFSQRTREMGHPA
jgi:hypothetical protein